MVKNAENLKSRLLDLVKNDEEIMAIELEKALKNWPSFIRSVELLKAPPSLHLFFVEDMILSLQNPMNQNISLPTWPRKMHACVHWQVSLSQTIMKPRKIYFGPTFNTNF